ncbi:MAG: bifunctional phosphoribosylaminoimidazolecarboxamide formyltransferase/IMP cyclohydrolase [Elusimicrobiota bacterium]
MNIAVFASGNGSNFKNLSELKKIGYLKPEIQILITNKECKAIEIAENYGIKHKTLKPSEFRSKEHYSDALIKEMEENKIELIVLAGYLLKLPDKLIEKYYGKIINIHPALLPSFGGKGFYGENVHKSVIERGCKISGITIHFVDSKYDNGPIILQKTVNISNEETVESLSSKIHSLEYFYYPYVINLISENIIKLEKDNVVITDKKSSSKHALISVSDKEGIVETAKKLNEKGFLIISTGGTYKTLIENNIKAVNIDFVTGFPEILDGRVKTLNNTIFGGILGIRNNSEHLRQMNENFIPNIDLIISNLYPFKEAAKKYECFEPELIENIDIGGVSLIRGAAKNWENVLILTDKKDYERLLKEIDSPSEDFKKELMIKAFKHTSDYDKAIYEKLSDYKEYSINLKKVYDLRYGENPHQKSSLYTLSDKPPFEQIWGKELSYNNILDLYGSWQAVCDFQDPACVIFKHVTPCGIAMDNDLTVAFEKAYASDPLSAFGGVIALNKKVNKKIAEYLSDKFVEIISAPDFDEEAAEVFKKKKNLRIVKWNKDIRNFELYKSMGKEFLISDPDNIVLSDKWEEVSGEVSEEEKKALIFAFTCVKHVKSNAIVLTTQNSTVGIGAGQMSRVDAVTMAEYKYKEYLKNNPKPDFIVMGSDAFFPFPDSIIKAKEIGVKAVIQPGGSIRDKEVIEKANELGIKMVLTGVRHFKH